MNGVHLALRHEGKKVNRIVMTSERMANCPPVKEWSKSFGFDSSSSLVVGFLNLQSSKIKASTSKPHFLAIFDTITK
ncbi:hypothetical protein TNCV_3278501 [Trichonephila clavipes]|nr:hypothetical protein TNCV_3278501 [Trichonephila clavipes]